MRPLLAIIALVSCRAEPPTAPTAAVEATPPVAAAPIDRNCEPDVATEPAPGADRIAFEGEDGGWGYRDAAGNVVIAPTLFVAGAFTAEGTAGVIAQDGAWFIDRSGRRLAAAMMFDNGPDYFVQGLARIVEGGKHGFIDRAGTIVIAPQFDGAGSFCEGRAPVCMGCRPVQRGEHTELVGGQWGFIDRTGRPVIPIVYDEVWAFTDGAATVTKAGQRTRVDHDGRALPPQPDPR